MYVDFDSAALSRGAVPGGKGGRRLDRCGIFAAAGSSPANHDMRAANAASVEPGVVWSRDVEGHHLILEATAADIDAVPLGIDEWLRPA